MMSSAGSSKVTVSSLQKELSAKNIRFAKSAKKQVGHCLQAHARGKKKLPGEMKIELKILVAVRRIKYFVALFMPRAGSDYATPYGMRVTRLGSGFWAHFWICRVLCQGRFVFCHTR